MLSPPYSVICTYYRFRKARFAIYEGYYSKYKVVFVWNGLIYYELSNMREDPK